MKKLCLLAICLMFAVPASAQNLLANADLETATEPPWIRWQAAWSTGPSWLVGPPGYLSANGMHLDELTNNGSFGFYQVAVAPAGHIVTVDAMWEGSGFAPNGWAEVMLFSVPVGTSGASIAAQIDTGAAGDIAFKKDSWGMNPPIPWTWQLASLSPATGGNAGTVVSQGWVVVATKCGNGALLSYDDFVLLDTTPGAGKNPVTVDAGGTGDYLTIQAAISSFAQGGANSGMTPPFVINVVPGTYDEMLTLMDTDVGLGDIQGDIVIQSSVPGTRPVIHLQKNPATANGLEIFTDSYNVTFNDLLLCPSQTGTLVTSALIHVDQTNTDTVYDTLAFSNCILTQIDPGGNPWITTRQQAYAPPADWTSPVPMTYQLYFYPDAGEPKNLTLDECVFYCSYGGGWGTGMTGTHLRVYQQTAGDVTTINNCVFAYSGNYSVMLYGSAAGVTNITGTDQTLGPDYCTYFLQQWEVDDHQLYPASAAIIVNISNTIFHAHGPELTTTAGTQGPRTISAGGAQIATLNDTIMYNECTGGAKNALAVIVDTIVAGESDQWNRVTLGGPVRKFYNTGTNGDTLTVRDCILSGGATVWGTLSAGAVVDVDYSAYVEAGPDAITDRGSGQTDGANVVGGASSDPSYKSKDPTNEDYFDVSNSYYGGKGTAGSDLSGGADYDPPFVEEWASY